ncbi:MAG: hypothetical protein R2725_02620 [Solirubrobacterales bacterium]
MRTEAGATVVETLPEPEVFEGHHVPANRYLRAEHAGGAKLTTVAGGVAELIDRSVADPNCYDVDEIHEAKTTPCPFLGIRSV